MADEGILNYIKDNLSRGVDIEDIKASLRKNGWPEDQIEQAVQAAGAQTQAQPAAPMEAVQPSRKPKEEKPKEANKGGVSKKLILALIILVILVIAFMYVSLDILNTFYTMFPEASSGLGTNLPVTG